MTLFASIAAAFSPAQEFNIPLHDGNELVVTPYGPVSETVLVWWPATSMPINTQTELAAQFAQAGLTVWLTNPIESRFLPDTNSSYYLIPHSDLVSLLTYAQDNHIKQVFLMAAGSGAIPVLHAAYQWISTHPQSALLKGVIFNSPMFYQETPDPGEPGELMPVVNVTNLPIYILQPALSPRYWQLKSVVPVLQQNGSDVFVQVLKNVRGRFHYRPDAEPHEIDETRRLAQYVKHAVTLLGNIAYKPRQMRALNEKNPPVREGKKDRYLAAYTGDTTPPLLRLNNLAGGVVNLEELRGQVVLVNFWTTWCPPCVHEMPSMQRLDDHFNGKPFTVLGVNMAETRETITDFLTKKVNVKFPILLDEEGATLQRWRVYAFPTSFVVDKHGKIRYALFGSIDWDTPEIITTIEKLIAE